jgi:hypothetical protein
MYTHDCLLAPEERGEVGRWGGCAGIVAKDYR